MAKASEKIEIEVVEKVAATKAHEKKKTVKNVVIRLAGPRPVIRVDFGDRDLLDTIVEDGDAAAVELLAAVKKFVTR